MRIVLTVADHEHNGFVALARWSSMSEDGARLAIAAIDAAITDEMEPDILTGPFNFILDLVYDATGDLLETGTRVLPMQIAMRLAPAQVGRWLLEKPDPDSVMNRAIPTLERFPVSVR